MSADTVSTLYPDRPIRPLPRRRLREKLSPDVADTIEYPPAPQGNTSLFYYPYDTKEEDYELKSSVLREIAQSASADPASRQAERLAAERQFMAQSAADRLARQQNGVGTDRSGRVPGAYPGTIEQPTFDGYDSLENANNKKKRKIPSAGEASLNGMRSLSEESHHAATVDATGDLSGDGAGPTSTPYYVPNTFGTSSGGMSGPGRGRLGRLRKGRSPLRALPETNSKWGGRNGKLHSPQWANEKKHGTDSSGIISAAIADAEKTFSPGQENISPLQQYQNNGKTTPTSTQFTFTCDSQAPGTFAAWSPPSQSDLRQSDSGVSLHAPVNSAGYRNSAASQQYPASQTGQMAPANATSGTQQPAGVSGQHPADALPKKPKRTAKDYYAMAANRRRERQRQYNIQHPPRDEDIWICHYCEYEMIFGYPPEALIRRYEIVDHKVRLQEKERRRLLEKAKMRGRKGRKAKQTAAAPKTSTGQDASLPHRPVQGSNGQQIGGQGGQPADSGSDEYYDFEGDPPPPSDPQSINEVESERAKLDAQKAQLAKEKAKLERVKNRLEKQVDGLRGQAGAEARNRLNAAQAVTASKA